MNLTGTQEGICIKSERTIRIESTQIRWFSWWPGREAGPHERQPKATQGGLSELSPLRSDGSCDGQAGRLNRMRDGQKTLKIKLNLKGDYHDRVDSCPMVLMVVRQGGCAAWTVAKDAQMSVRKWRWKAKGPSLKSRHSDSPKKSQFILSKGMFQEWDDGDDVDDEVRTIVLSQNCV
jgi:hypothetical protein